MDATQRTAPLTAPRPRPGLPRLAAEADGERLRLEVSDTRAERRPVVAVPTEPVGESGRGLIVAALTGRRGGPGRTVWAAVSTT